MREDLRHEASALRAVGVGPMVQARTLLARGYGSEEVMDVLLTFERNPLKKLDLAVGVAERLIPFLVAAWGLQAHGVHPASLAFAQMPAKVPDYLHRMAMGNGFKGWKLVDGQIEITGDSEMVSLPPGLLLPFWNVAIRACPRFKDPGARLVTRRLHIQSCPSLKRLPNGLGSWGQGVPDNSVPVCLNQQLDSSMAIRLEQCPVLETIGNLQVVRMLALNQCGGTAPLSDLALASVLWLRDCPNFERLPEELLVLELLYLEGLPRLQALPDGLVVGNDLEIRNCPRFERLPERLEVPGDLTLHDLPTLEGLPADLKVGGTIRIRGCPRPRVGGGGQVSAGLVHQGSHPT